MTRAEYDVLALSAMQPLVAELLCAAGSIAYGDHVRAQWWLKFSARDAEWIRACLSGDLSLYLNAIGSAAA